MILRVFRYRLREGGRQALEAAVLAEGLPRISQLPDLRFALAARSGDETGVVLTGWDRFDAITQSIGAELDRPVFLPRAARALFTMGDATHYEALDLPRVGSGDPTVLRLMSGDVEGIGEAAYFEWVRSRLWPALGRIDGLAGAWVGRQGGESLADPVLGVTVWTSRAAVEAAGVVEGPFTVDGDPGPFRFHRVELLELYGVLAEDRIPRVMDEAG